MKFEYSVFTSNPSAVGKQYSKDPETGEPRSTHKSFIKGYVEGRTAKSLLEFGNALDNLSSHQFITAGIPKGRTGRLEVAPQKYKQPGQIARTQEYFSYNGEFVLIPLDNDTGIQREDFEVIMGQSIPNFSNIDRLYRLSSSSLIRDQGLPIKGGVRFHGYILARIDPSEDYKDQINRFRKIIRVRQWLAGGGHLFISKAGRVHRRCEVDLATIGRPEMPLFEGPPTVKGGLDVISNKTDFIEGDYGYIDLATLTPLTDGERLRFEELVDDEKERRKDEIETVRAKYADVQIPKLMKRGLSQDRANLVVRGARDIKVLTKDWELKLDDGKIITVRELLNNLDGFDKITMADPLC